MRELAVEKKEAKQNHWCGKDEIEIAVKQLSFVIGSE